MELTKEQIQFIDHRLENEGVKYLEIRLEILDHIVSDIEIKLKPENSENEFKEIVQNVFVSLGWKENFNGSNFPNTDKNASKRLNKEYRKMYNEGFINFFKSLKNIGIFLCFLIVFIGVSKNLDVKIFKRISFVLFILPIVVIIFYSLKIYMRKYEKSIHLNYGFFYFGFAFMMISLPIQLLKYFSESIQKSFFLIAIPFFYIFTYSGYQVYKKAIGKVEKIRKQLL